MGRTFPLPTTKPDARRYPKPARGEEPFPPDLLEVEGLLGLFVAECVRSAPERRQPVYALATAICVVGALAGRRYRSDTDLRTNVYAAVLGPSSSGKNHSQRVASQLLTKAGLGHYIAADYQSGASVMSELAEFPVRLAIVDEFGIWLSQLTGERAPKHLAEIRKRLMELFSKAGDVMPGAGYADRKLRERKDIHQPHLCFVGLGTPDNFFSALQSGALKDGFIPRFLVFRPDTYIPELVREPAALSISDDMVISAQQIADASPDDLSGILRMQSDKTMDAQTVPFDVGGRAEHERYREIREAVIQDGYPGFCEPALVGKWSEHAIKLAMIRAISRDPVSPFMDRVCVNWGYRVAEWCMHAINSMGARHIADNQIEAEYKRVRNVIADAGSTWITKSELIRKTQSIALGRREQIITGLIESKEIQSERTEPGPSGGRPSYRFRRLPDEETS